MVLCETTNELPAAALYGGDSSLGVAVDPRWPIGEETQRLEEVTYFLCGQTRREERGELCLC